MRVSSRLALVAARLFDSASATVRERPVLLIEGERIADVAFGVEPPPDAPVHDLGDATLLPGLIDPHVHLALDASPDPVARLAARSDSELVAAMERAARTAARAGITTMRDLGDRGYLSLGLRGRPDLPTLLAAGPPITLAGGHCHFLGGRVEPGPDGMRAGVRERAERGVDVVKIMASGGTLTPGTFQHQAQFDVDDLRAAVDESHRLGLPVTAHAHATAAVVNALDAGVDGIEHATFWTEEGVASPTDVLARIVERGVTVGATVGVLPTSAGPPPAVAARLRPMLANLRYLHEAGAVMVAGSDAGIGPPKPHDVLPYALAMLVGAGFGPAAVLQMMTRGAADACGLGDRKGRLATGYDADVLAVHGDPVGTVAAIHDVAAVYLRGAAIR